MPEGYLPRPHESIEVDRGIEGRDISRPWYTFCWPGANSHDGDQALRNPCHGQQGSCRSLCRVRMHWANTFRFSATYATVVGVVANAKYRRLTYDPAPLLWCP